MGHLYPTSSCNWEQNEWQRLQRTAGEMFFGHDKVTVLMNS